MLSLRIRVAVASLALCAVAQAQQPAQPQPRNPPQPAVPVADGPGGLPWLRDSQAWVEEALAAAQPSGLAPLRMVVSFGSLDSRLSLAPCAAVEPYLPAGTRLWGRTRLGLRCVDGLVRWNVFLPLTVQAFGPAWVLRADVPAGKVLGREDAELAEVDWAQQSQPVLAEPSGWVGQTATRALSAGTALRSGLVRPAQVFQAGASVRVVAQGPGFQVSTDGQALTPGVVGAVARVRVDNGRILTGTVLDPRTVRVDL